MVTQCNTHYYEGTSYFCGKGRWIEPQTCKTVQLGEASGKIPPVLDSKFISNLDE